MSQRPRKAFLLKIGGLESAHRLTKERSGHDNFVPLMTEKSSGDDVTGFLASWAAGDLEALDQLTTQVYERMRLLAATFLRHERADHTLQTAALIHEAFLRLVKLLDDGATAAGLPYLVMEFNPQSAGGPLEAWRRL